MKVIFDGAIYSIQKHGGINRYFKNLMQHLPDSISLSLVTSVIPDDLPERVNVFQCYSPKWASSIKSLRRMFEARQCRNIYKREKADLVHVTYNRPLTRDYLGEPSKGDKPVPLVLTVYDFTHERFRDSIKNAERQVEWKRKAIQRADAIICISESTLQDLREYYPAESEKASVIYLADELGAVQADQQGIESWLSNPYFLFVGGRVDYKNFQSLLPTFRKVHQKFPEFRLICVGKPFGQLEQKLIDEAGLGDAVFSIGHASDRQLKMLYQRCRAFVYPSLYEGFGIPLLEAMGCGAPILASDRSCFPEILGDAGWLFDPENGNDITEKLMAVASGDFDRDEFAKRGLQRYTMFSWEKSASRTAELYQQLV